MPNAANNGMRRIVNATFFSLAGLRYAWENEPAFRQECFAAALLVPAALWLGTSPVEHALLIGSCLFVLVVELLNSAIEAVIDRIGPDRHVLAQRAKDLASAAVFASLLLTVAVWAVIAYGRFGPA